MLPLSSRRRAAAACAAAVALGAALPTGPADAQRRPAVRPASAPATPAVDASRFSGLAYRNVGPNRGGRVTAVAGHRLLPRTFWFGSTGGGVWRTDDAGQSWRNLSDGWFETGSIGAVTVAPSDTGVLWVGTGSDGIRSNVIHGRGVYVTRDGGASWTHAGLRDAGQIGAVEVHPTDPNRVYVAAIGNAFRPSSERGVYRTSDGGTSWQRVLYVSDSTGAVDVVLDPSDPNTLYAAMWRAERKPWTIISGAREGGLYKSTNGGDTWTKLAGGLPSGVFGKADLAISPADPRRVYALIEAPDGQGGLWRSDDAGATWAQVNALPNLTYRAFYYTNVDVDPKNPDVVYVSNETFFRSADGGKTMRPLETPHGDNHGMWINPDDPRVFIQANDGGVNVSLDGGATWSTQYNQPTAELYQVNVDDQVPYRLYGAQQDNSTLIVPSQALTSGAPDDWQQQWMQGAGCETGPILPHPTNPDTVYGACKGQFSRLSLRTGQEKHYWVGGQYMYGHDPKDLKLRFQRTAPIEISPHDARVIYHGSQFVHRTTDEGVTWETISPDLTAFDPKTQGISGSPITRDVTGEEFYSTLYAIRESPLEPGVIWAGANDGPIHVTRDGGKTWTNVTPKGLPAGGRVQHLEPSPHRKGSAYAAVYRYLLGDFEPYVYRTNDYGRTWTRLTTGRNGVPADVPTRVVREDPAREGLLYLGTEFGMYVSLDDGATWQPFQQNLPATPVTDIKVHRGDLVLSTMGRGFWILDDLSPVRQAARVPAGAVAHLYQPSDAMRLRVAASPRGVPEYPVPGARLDFWLARAPQGEVALEILDSAGTVLRRVTTGGPGQRTETTQQMRAPRLRTVGAPRLEPVAGMQRFVWDLTLDAPGGRGRGPLVPPGQYAARLTTPDGWSETRRFAVTIDPRVAADGVTAADLAEQTRFQLQVAEAMARTQRLVAAVRAERERAGTTSDHAGRLATLERALVTAPGRYQQPMLADQLGYLYGMVSRADQRIGRDAVARLAELEAELARHEAALRALGGRVAEG